MKPRLVIIFGFGIVVLVLAFSLSISVGAVSIPLLEVGRLLLNPDSSALAIIVHSLRVPRALVAVMVGSSLAISGTLFQALTRNPLVGPGILGVNAGAMLAILLAIVFVPTVPSGILVLLAFGGGLGAATLTFLSTVSFGISPIRLALAGIAVGALLTAISSGIQVIFEERARAIIFSVVGSLAGRTWEHVWMILPWFLLGSILAMLFAQRLNLIALAEDTATGLGLRVQQTRWLLIALAVLLAAAATSVAGPIGFLGLMSPHLARGLVGADNRLVIPLAALIGSSILLLADVAARVVDAPLETPVGILITAIGAPFFVFLVRRIHS